MQMTEKLFMKISFSIKDLIINSTPDVPPETGGIIGGRNGIISEFYADGGVGDNPEFEYEPDTESLNRIIDEWQKRGIDFYGIYHSHRLCGQTLSKSDKIYISQIMTTLKDYKNCLYFPLVFPKEKMICFKAELINGETVITNENIEIF